MRGQIGDVFALGSVFAASPGAMQGVITLGDIAAGSLQLTREEAGGQV